MLRPAYTRPVRACQMFRAHETTIRGDLMTAMENGVLENQFPTKTFGLDRARIAVLVPCYNEALTIGDVVTSFRAALPDARIYVYDNNSTDGTSEVAAAAGAIVRHET